MKEVKVNSGEWVQPIRRGYQMGCCDCGLYHIINFRLVKNKRGNFIQFQAFRSEKMTEKSRKRSGGIRWGKGKIDSI